MNDEIKSLSNRIKSVESFILFIIITIILCVASVSYMFGLMVKIQNEELLYIKSDIAHLERAIMSGNSRKVLKKLIIENLRNK